MALAVAGVFGLHPLRVESVAWAAERKDVLSAFFFLAGLAAYGWWLRRPSAGRYAGVVGAHALGLLSKPMVVTFPVVLLVLDWWPLGRLRRGEAVRRVVEKAPLLALSAALGVVTYLVAGGGGSVKDWTGLSLLVAGGERGGVGGDVPGDVRLADGPGGLLPAPAGGSGVVAGGGVRGGAGAG